MKKKIFFFYFLIYKEDIWPFFFSFQHHNFYIIFLNYLITKFLKAILIQKKNTIFFFLFIYKLVKKINIPFNK